MSEEVSQSSAPFDLERLQQLIELMEKHGLSEVSLRRGDEQWRLRRGPIGVAAPPVYAAPPAAAPALAPPVAAPPAAPAETDGRFVDIKSPTVGTFYASPTPDDPPFVKPGSPVTPETIVCIVEAMKVFNQIPAEISGTIVAALVSTGDPVEFGQPLFRVQVG